MPQFTSPDHLARHLNDHVLTPVESHAWAVLFGDAFPFLRDSQEALDQCFRIRVALAQKHSDEAIEELKSQYQAVAQKALDESVVIGWSITRNHETIGVALNGVFVTTRILQTGQLRFKTAYLPGHGTAEGTRRSQDDRGNPHARVDGDRAMRARHRTKDESTREARRKADIRAGWSHEQWVYHLCFVTMLDRLLHWNGDQQNINHQRGVPDISELKRLLPRKKYISFEVWQRRVQEAESRI